MTDRLVIVEDHGLIAHTMSAALRMHGVSVSVLDPQETPDLTQAITDCEPDLALLDLDLGDGRTAVDLLPPLVTAGVPALVVTGVADRMRHAACVEAGALAVVQKHVSFDRLLGSVKAALHGDTLLTKHERDDLLADLRRHRAEQQARLAPFRRLSPRESEVLAALRRGCSVDEIAAESFVSVATVRTQVRAILTKLGVNSQLAAIAMANTADWPANSTHD